METVSARILKEVAGMPEATPIYAKGLLHLGSRAAVDQALSRLTHRRELLRVARGLYLRPTETRFGPRPPGVEVVLRALQEDSGEIFAPSGAAAANRLGLTTQVPVRTIYLTSGPTRGLHFGGQTVELRHAPQWQLMLPEHTAGDVVRAFAWLGRARCAELTSRLQGKLSKETLRELSRTRGRMPTWMAEQISKLIASISILGSGNGVHDTRAGSQPPCR